MFIASDLHFWRGHSQGRSIGRKMRPFFSSTASRAELPPCMEKLTVKRMDLMDSHKDVAINEQSWNSWHFSGLCSTAAFDVSYLETPWPLSLVLSVRRMSISISLTSLTLLLSSSADNHKYTTAFWRTAESTGITFCGSWLRVPGRHWPGRALCMSVCPSSPCQDWLLRHHAHWEHSRHSCHFWPLSCWCRTRNEKLIQTIT